MGGRVTCGKKLSSLYIKLITLLQVLVKLLQVLVTSSCYKLISERPANKSLSNWVGL